VNQKEQPLQHLRFKMFEAQEMGVTKHPQQVMKELGITYQLATPHSLGDEWWFWNCRNAPENLPGYLSIIVVDNPLKFVGWGLSQEEAEAIRDYV
jgi:hypothetical protein